MEALFAEAAYCTQGEERARALLESVRGMNATEKTDRWTLLATTLCQQAVFELETRAVEVDALIEAADTSCRSPYTCPSLVMLEALEGQFAVLNTEEEKWPLFKEAIEKGDVALVDLLILAGVDPTADDNTAVIWASQLGHLSVVDRLIQDARVDPTAAFNNEAIQRASDNGHLPIVNRLLQDARVDPSAYNNFAFRKASEHGHLPVVNRLLLDARVDPSAGNNWAIRWASHMGHLAVVDRLLQDARMDPSAHYNRAIRLAYANSQTSIVKRLLQDERVSSTLSIIEKTRLGGDNNG